MEPSVVEKGESGLCEMNFSAEKSRVEDYDTAEFQAPYETSVLLRPMENEKVAQFPFIVEVSNPSKVGEGMSAHIVYEVHFKGLASPFEQQESSVARRFSDFLGLYAKLCERHLPHGIIIPPAPEKDVLGTTKVKISKDANIESEFVERRRMALTRFLYRLLSHPVLRNDADLQAFLTQQSDLPRATNTQLLSGASAKKMFRNFGDALGKIAYKMDDPEEYFELKAEELENWERQLKRLHGALTSLVTNDQELSNTKFLVSRSIAQLANVEEHTGLAQALSRLAATEEEVSHKHAVQSEAELVRLVECARETLGLIQGCKDVLGERVKAFRNWKAAEAALRSKREQKIRLELAGKGDQRKMSLLEAEIEDLTNRVDQEEENFKQISRTIKEELDRFDVTRFTDFKRAATEFLEVMLQTQMKLLEVWEAYSVHAKSIN